MKFYFCEKCGKRITEQDIDQGLGKNKKLKGVYCRACAAGVMTLETLPLTDAEARDILAQSAPSTSTAAPASFSTPTASAKRRKRRSSAAHVIPPIPAPALKHVEARQERTRPRLSRIEPPEKERAAPPRSGSMTLPLAMAAAGVVLALLGGFLIFGNSSPPPRTAEVSPGHATRAGPDAHAENPERAPGAISRVPQAVAQKRPEQASPPERKIKKTGTAASADPAVKPPAPADPADPAPQQAPGQEPPANTNTAGTAGRGVPEKETSKLPAPPAPPPLPPRPARPAPKPHELAFDQYLDDLFSALQQKDLARAETLAQEMAKGEAFGEWARGAQKMPAAIGVLTQEEQAKQAALRKLVGRGVRLETSKGTLKVKVLAVEGKGEKETLSVQREFTINGEVRAGERLTVALSELTAAFRKRLFPPKAPRTPEAWAARALLDLAKKRLPEAGAAIKQLKDSPLRAPLAWRLEKENWSAREASARAAWAALFSRARTVKKLDDDRAKALLKEMAAFEKEYEGTLFAWSGIEERRALKARLGGIAAALDKRLAALFHGQVLAVNGKQRTISLVYDFSDPEQALDFKFSNPGGRAGGTRLQGGKLALHCGSVVNQIVEMPGWTPDALTLTLHYKINTWGFQDKQPNAYWAVWLGLPVRENKKTLPAVIFQMKKNNRGMVSEDPEGYRKKYKSVAGRPPRKGKLELARRGKRFSATLNGRPILDLTLPEGIRLRPGFALGGGWDVDYTIQRMEISGTLEKAWLEQALAR